MIWVISDIHGMYDRLLNLIQKIPENDKIIFLGDYIDRGPDSKLVLDLLFQLKDRAIFLKGNHEDMMIDYLENNGKYLEGIWFRNGGLHTLKSFNNNVEDKYIDFLKSLKLYHIEEIEGVKYLFVHAGVRYGITLEDQSERDLLWIRSEFYMQNYKYDDYIVIHGHTPTSYISGEYNVYFHMMNNIYNTNNIKDELDNLISIDIDTGCVYGGKLTAFGIGKNYRILYG
ncbi:metallophosphoesterase family protein [Marinitoga litoralis]|uniref:metallophosphoesterase family protein n=1 Tax=Marinitoga litoralis TaxID=570855 RepID=UPI001960C27E|nr:metallophosphoesterase family protein [Marinitoga litoralis]MBM7559735.1 serine/threonine protein phosphatase 1 [Marinitoga litoralis]